MAPNDRLSAITAQLSSPPPRSARPSEPLRDRTSPASYSYWLPIQTRWLDNDVYTHMNNTIHYTFFDTIANHFLIHHCALNPSSSSSTPIGLIVNSGCTYLAALGFPEPVLAGLSIGKVGRSSVEWRVALFPAKVKEGSGGAAFTEEGKVEVAYEVGGKCAAYGSFTHVFVDPQSRKSVEVPENVKEGLKLLQRNP